MSFALSAQETRVDDGHILRASLQAADGSWVDAELDLDNIIGNDDGMWTDRYIPIKDHTLIIGSKAPSSGTELTFPRAPRTSLSHLRAATRFPFSGLLSPTGKVAT